MKWRLFAQNNRLRKRLFTNRHLESGESAEALPLPVVSGV
jgi:hypothetical protein